MNNNQNNSSSDPKVIVTFDGNFWVVKSPLQTKESLFVDEKEAVDSGIEQSKLVSEILDSSCELIVKRKDNSIRSKDSYPPQYFGFKSCQGG